MSMDAKHMPLGKARAVAEAALPRLRIFPLSEGVLLPGAAVPLHVFEPRYRVMVAHCRASDQVLALASLVSSDEQDQEMPAVYPTVGVGMVVYDRLLPDGRSVILVRGLMRARITEELPGEHPYRLVRARRLVDPVVSAAEARPATTVTRHLVRSVALRVRPEEGAEKLLDLVASETDPGMLADLLGSVFITHPTERQELLEDLWPVHRLERVNRHLATLIDGLGDPEIARAVN